MEFETRAKRRRQRARKLAHEREEYFRLMDQGLSSKEACKLGNGNRPTTRSARGSLPVSFPEGGPSSAVWLPAAGRARTAAAMRRHVAQRALPAASGADRGATHQPGRRQPLPAHPVGQALGTAIAPLDQWAKTWARHTAVSPKQP
jgi:transposase, IS30 family